MLSRDQFIDCFPFHFVVDANGQITQLGRSLERLCTTMRKGISLKDGFDVRRSSSERLELDNFAPKTLYILDHRTSACQLRGEFVPQPDGGYVFLGSPWVKAASDLEELGLSLEDFAVHNTLGDHLYLLQDKELSFRDKEAMTHSILQKKDALQRRDEQLRALGSRFPGGVILFNDDLQVVFADGTELPFEPVPLVAGPKSLKELFGDKDAGVFEEHLADCLENGSCRFEVTYGSSTYLNSAEPFSWKDKGSAGIWILQDITSQLMMEREQERSNRLDSLGLLAGGIAHDFNNLLAGILGNISLSLSCDGLPGDVPKYLESAEAACERATDLTKQLLTFARGGKPICTRQNIGRLFVEGIRFGLHGSNVVFVEDLPRNTCFSEVDAGQMNQVINNLAINACQAMPKGGQLNLSARLRSVEESEVANLSSGDYWQLTVTDNGPGIEPDLLRRIFDPYFSTKEEGTGLGLAIAYSIARRHQGHIFAESELGEGASFHLLVPAVEKAALPAFTEFPEVLGALPSGHLLVMDDEPLVLETAERILNNLGQTVVTTSSGEQALEAYREALALGEPFGMVLLDLTVPGGMGGIDTLRALQEVDPNVRAVVSSGYSNDLQASYESYGFCGALKKPYSIQDMQYVLAEHLSVPRV